ncbi:MAG: type IV pilus modification protein PilV [Thiobacillus sp.]|nr:type IV pilus modification protein PilV [Thiobacillus sp.]
MSLRVRLSGFTMIEVLVAIVVLSLGLLGLAGLQAASLRNNQTAYYRGIATQQAYDMADRLRANLAGVRAGDYSNLAAGLPGSNPNCFASACTPANMAISDHFQWNTMNAALLPGGTGTVRCLDGRAGAGCVASTGRWVFQINIQWAERTEAGVSTQDFVTFVEP